MAMRPIRIIWLRAITIVCGIVVTNAFVDALCAQTGNLPDQAPGQRVHVRPSDLPPPNATPSASNPSTFKAVDASVSLRTLPGFKANAFGIVSHPRQIAVAPNGDVFVTSQSSSKITVLRDANGDGIAEETAVFHEGLARPHGLAFRPGWLYVADTQAVWRFAYAPGQSAAKGPPERVTAEGALGEGSGHWTRNIAFSRDGRKFYVSIGSRGNIDEEPLPRATIQEFSVDGSGQRTYASGLRNPVGIAVMPGTDDVYTVVNERDGMGDGLVPDFLTRVDRNGFYGWPYAYIGPNRQPGFAEKRPEMVERTLVPDVLFKSHSAPIGLVFYDGDQFPPDYRGDAFVALRGSWNSARPAGYTVVRVPFRDGRPFGHYEVFLSGFWFEGRDKAVVRGRPVGVAVAKDGSLLVSDEHGSIVWRVSHTK
jgi:glucose/arabinose dehydrogenase